MTETTELYPGKELKALTVGIIGGTGAQGTGLGYRLAKAGFKVILRFTRWRKSSYNCSRSWPRHYRCWQC